MTINPGTSSTSPSHCHRWRVQGVYAVSQKEAKGSLRNVSKSHVETPLNREMRKQDLQESVHRTSALLVFFNQESGRDTPSTNQASSINGTDDEKISHVSPEAAVLKTENERLKSAIEQRQGFDFLD